jgi:hypothetical protein
MTDPNELEALRASLRGVQRAAADIDAQAGRFAALDEGEDVAESDLEALQRVSLANAVAAEALRGLLKMMLKRRGKGADEEATESSSADEER